VVLEKDVDGKNILKITVKASGPRGESQQLKAKSELCSAEHIEPAISMTKFGKAGKTRLSSLLNRSIWFWQFQSKTEEGAKLEDLKIQGALKQEKGLKGIKEPR
jgi:hypothetical protein